MVAKMNDKGFTLIELLIAIALGAILLGIAIPGLSSLVSSTALDTEANTISNTLRSARNHAIDLNQRIVVCFTDSTNNCKSNGFDHLFIFNDNNNNGSYDSASEKIISSGSVFDRSVNITPNAANFIFSSDGSISANSTVTVCHHDQSISTSGKTVTVALSGRTTISDSSCN
jgi:prepilin-type N-terminal cleavage/methylation domain-containing protein